MEINKKEFDKCIDSFIEKISSKEFLQEIIKEYKVIDDYLEERVKEFIESKFVLECQCYLISHSNISIGFISNTDNNLTYSTVTGISIKSDEKLYNDDHIFNNIEIYFNDDQRKRFNDAIYKIYSIIYFIKYKVIDILIDNESFLSIMIDLYNQESNKEKLCKEYYMYD